jgi:hypothetical protein
MDRISPSRSTLFLCGLIGIIAAAGSAFGRSFPERPRVLNPKTYLSPSGQYALLVDPSDMYGRFGASYRLTRQGREVWSGQRPFTLWEAAVTDAGVVGGCAYSLGWSGNTDGHDGERHGNLHVILIDAQGTLRLDQVTKREHGGYPNAPPKPVASGLFLDPENDRLVVRIADFNLGHEEWWSFQIATAKPLGICRPKELMADPNPVAYSLDARPVAGTSLTLVHWRREDVQADRDGARFTLVDTTGNSVWSLDWPSDYQVPNDEKAEIRLWKELHEHGAILRCDQRGQFDLWCARDAERVMFNVRAGAAGKWLVAETNRQPYVTPVKTEPPPVPIPEWRPHVSGRITLRVPELEPAPLIREVNGFARHVERLDCAAVTVDVAGRIYAVAATTMTVHVFDLDGRWLRACKLESHGTPADLRDTDITASDRGDIFMSLSTLDGRRHLHYSGEGKRVGFESLPAKFATQMWCPQPGTARRWVLCGEVALLVESSGAVIRTIARRCDRIWLDSVEKGSVASDGSIAIVARASALPGAPYTVNIYTAQGEPIQTIHLPNSITWSHPQVAYDGRRLVLVQGHQIVAFDATGKVIGRLAGLPVGERESTWTPFLTRGGRELLLSNGRNSIYRFAMP